MEKFFIDCNIDDDCIARYVELFKNAKIDKNILFALTDSQLKELGIVIGDRIRILNGIRKKNTLVEDGIVERQCVQTLSERIQDSVAFIRSRIVTDASLAIVLGSGLGELAKRVKNRVELSFQDIPHFTQTTAESHAGKLIFGNLNNTPVILLSGRTHPYEGFTLQQCTFPIRVLKALGIEILLLSNACGGINRNFSAGDIVLITNHLNLMFDNPLIGPNDSKIGVRWPHMKDPYDKNLNEIMKECAIKCDIDLKEGVYAAMLGPSGATRPELRMLSLLHADVYGMSTVPEVIAARHSGIASIVALSVITDMCRWDVDDDPTIEQCLQVANATAPNLCDLVLSFCSEC